MLVNVHVSVYTTDSSKHCCHGTLLLIIVRTTSLLYCIYDIILTVCYVQSCRCGFAERFLRVKGSWDWSQVEEIHLWHIILIHRPPVCYVLYRMDEKVKFYLKWHNCHWLPQITNTHVVWTGGVACCVSCCWGLICPQSMHSKLLHIQSQLFPFWAKQLPHACVTEASCITKQLNMLGGCDALKN